MSDSEAHRPVEGRCARIRLERTRDPEQVAAILTHPAIYPGFMHDAQPAPANFWPAMEESVFHLLAFEGEALLGLFLTHSINPWLWEVHVAMLPRAVGRRARAAGEAFLSWLWTYTQCERLIGLIPDDNTLAVRYAKKLGMREEGRLSGCVLRRSERRDLILLSQARPH